MSKKKIVQFPCRDDLGKYVSYEDCQNCEHSDSCDIYALMLDENFDDE